MSKLQEETKQQLRITLSGTNFIENYRPDWLSNPNTGQNLELDFYFPDAKIGIEVQGEQHYSFTPAFHKTQDDFYRQLERDKIKRELCNKNGIKLYEILNNDDIKKFILEAKELEQSIRHGLHKRRTAMTSVSYYLAQVIIEQQKQYPHQDRLNSLIRKIENICRKYNISIKDISPNFSIKRQQLQQVHSQRS